MPAEGLTFDKRVVNTCVQQVVAAGRAYGAVTLVDFNGTNKI